MEGVDHVDVVEVCRRRFVGYVDRMFQREVPYGEGLELGVARPYAAFVLVVELREAHRHLSRAGSGCCHDDQGALGDDIVVFPESVVRCDEFDVVRVAVDEIVYESLYAHIAEPLSEGVGRRLSVVVCDDDGADKEPSVLELGAQAQRVFVVGDAEVGANLVLLDVFGADDDDYLYRVGELGQHAQFGIRLEAGQDAGSVMVVEEFAAEFKI